MMQGEEGGEKKIEKERQKRKKKHRREDATAKTAIAEGPPAFELPILK